jgi:hypothetical protein
MSVMSPQKRKRDSHDMPELRAAPGLSQDTSEFEQQYIHQAEDDEHQIDFSMSVMPQHQHTDDPMVTDQQPQQQPEQQSPNHQRSHSHSQQGVVSSATDTATAALAQYHTMSVPQPTENTFMHQPTEGGDRVSATPIDQTPGPRSGSFGEIDGNGQNGDASSPSGAQATPGGSKPSVGSEEWHKVRRDNHKEGKFQFVRCYSCIPAICTKSNNHSLVERRRRETINEGINEIAKIVPGCEKNKGSILARAVQFITQLKDNETQNIEKWTLEKLLTEQAIAELSSSCDKLKNECQRARAECELWKKAAQKAGVTSVEGVAPSAGANPGAVSGDAKEPVSVPTAPNTVAAAVAATAANEDTE